MMSNFENTKKSNPHTQSAYIKQTPTGEWGPHIWVDAPPSDGQTPAKTATQNAYTKTPPSEDGWAEHAWVGKIIKEGSLEGFGKWFLDEDGLLTIIGQGQMPDWNGFTTAPWNKIKGLIKTVSISSRVTKIGNHAFWWCVNLTKVTIPSSVTEIGEYAFSLCEKLTQITIPNSVKIIGEGAFMCCTNLPQITIPSNITTIGKYAFESCKNLKQVTIPDNVTIIERNTFWNCTNLREVTIPNSVTEIGYSAFGDCPNLQTVYMPRRFIWCSIESDYGIPRRKVIFT